MVLPLEWQIVSNPSTFIRSLTPFIKGLRPCLDNCVPSTLEDIRALFYDDTGLQVEDVFSEFDPEPIGVASLAQVHVAKHRATGQKVAVKIQHPHLQEFCAIE